MYKAGYKAYSRMISLIFLLIIVAGIILIENAISIFPIFLLGFIAIVGMIGYSFEIMK